MNDRREALARASAKWVAETAAAARAFDAATADPATAQRATLAAILRDNAHSGYGERYDFRTIDSVDEYQRRLPIVSYDDIAAELAAGGMTSAAPLMFETTSGSAAAAKRIPYTASLRRDFMRALDPWMHDLYASHPRLHGGSAYWSVSPVTGARGFRDDREYFDGPSRHALDEILSLPSEVAAIADVETSRYVTLNRLAADRELTFISVWNPGILPILVRDLERKFESIVHDVAAVDVGRARELELAGPRPSAIWPRLALISCWTDAAASLALPAVRRIFPGVEVQPKGLLATEGVVSIPFGAGRGAVLAVTSIFLEFRRAGSIELAHDLREGEEYEIILTTSGGLYRYAIGDLVRVVGRHRRTPRVEFVGRSGDVADIAGEKLSEPFVRSVLRQFDVETNLMFLAPEWRDGQGGYALFVESAAAESSLRDLASAVDAALAANLHYDYCRKAGQLGPIAMVRLRAGASDTYLRLRARACRLGDVKPRALEIDLGWMARLQAAEAVA